jgi:hypothetical protein
MTPYLSLRQAVRPAIFAHRLLAGDAERAGKLAAECEELLVLTRELVKAAGQARILDDRSAGSPGSLGFPGSSGSSGSSGSPGSPGSPGSSGSPGGRQAQILDAYADAAMSWAKVVGSLMALAGTLFERGDWDDVRRLADVLAETGEDAAAADLRTQLGRAVWDRYRDQLQHITAKMPPAEIRKGINALQAVLLEVPEDFPGRNREVNRLLVPLASSIHALMKDRGIEISYNSRVEHIATGGVARYPDIVKTSLDELSAEFEGTCK